ncbi:MAG: flagellar hook-length control protein FliK [Clostridiales bacterium]|jgi:hypothetical protein|nr:flagellar hook-length control protein FliK [Clostridiales bacterium]
MNVTRTEINAREPEVPAQQARSEISYKTLTSLQPGERFRATITDIQPNRVTIRLSSGETLTAKSYILPEARIGEETIFMVKENLKGQVLLEMLKPGADVMQKNIIKEALANLFLPVTEENIALAKALIENNLPLTKEMLEKALFIKYSAGAGISGTLDMDKILFLIKEGFPLSADSAAALNRALEGGFALKGNLAALAELLTQLPDTPLKRGILEALLPDGVPTTLPEAGEPDLEPAEEQAPAIPRELREERLVTAELLNRLAAETSPQAREALLNDLRAELKKAMFIPLDGDTVKNPGEYYKDLAEIVKLLTERLAASGKTVPEVLVPSETARAAGGMFEALRDDMRFMNSISVEREYIQIPFVLQNRENQGNLIIFKNRRGGGSLPHGSSCALIALDLEALGYVEVLVNKTYSSVSLEFRAKESASEKLFKHNAADLVSALQSRGYEARVGFKKLREPFRLTDPSPAEPGEKGPPKRYSFDMRV